MILQDLQAYSLVYLATPYTRYIHGPEIAFQEACVLAGEILRLGIVVYSPIAHGHPISEWGDLDPYDESVWMSLAETMVGKSDALLIARLDGWQESRGIAHERGLAASHGLPIYHLNPLSMELADV